MAPQNRANDDNGT